jgi:hypothetical protein
LFLLLAHVVDTPKRERDEKGAFYTAHSEPKSRLQKKNKKMFIQYRFGLSVYVIIVGKEDFDVIDAREDVVEPLHIASSKDWARMRTPRRFMALSSKMTADGVCN